MVTDYSKHRHFNGSGQAINEETGDLDIKDKLGRPQKILYETIKGFEEIKACLRLRYLTFRYVGFIEKNRDHMDIDPYDSYSTFLGAYNVTGGQKTLVGTLRIISGDEKGETVPYIEEIIRTARDPKIRELGKRAKLLPILESFDLPDSYFDCFNKSNPQGNSIRPYEISRLAIHPDYWMHGIDIGLHHLLILDSWLCEPPLNDFLIAVHPRSRRRYYKVGFEVIPNTKEVYYKHINQLAIAMIIDLGNFLHEPRWYNKTCKTLFPGFKKTGYYTRMTKKQVLFNSFKKNDKVNG